jgi:hypothetical protein
MKTTIPYFVLFPNFIKFVTKAEMDKLTHVLNNTLFRGNNNLDKHFIFLKNNKNKYAMRCKTEANKQLIWEIIIDLQNKEEKPPFFL